MATKQIEAEIYKIEYLSYRERMETTYVAMPMETGTGVVGYMRNALAEIDKAWDDIAPDGWLKSITCLSNGTILIPQDD